jgi:hypothetical protein
VEAEVKRRGEMLAVGGSAPFANRPPTAESGPADRNSVSNGN